MKILITQRPRRSTRPADRDERRRSCAIAAGRIVGASAASPPTSTPDRDDRRHAAASSRPAWSTWRRACASPATSTRACSRARWPRRWPAASPAWCCPPDTDPVLDEPGLVEMLKFRAREAAPVAALFPLGALTRGLAGEVLTEMAELTEAGCVGFSPGRGAAAPTPRCCSARCSTPPPSATPCGCARRTPGWARAWPPAARWPRGWACRACRWRPRPSRCTPSSSWCAPPARACTCAA